MEFDGDNAIEIAVLGRNALEDPQLHCMSTIVYSFLNVPEVLGAQPTLKADLNPAGDICGVNVAKCVEWMHSKCEAGFCSEMVRVRSTKPRLMEAVSGWRPQTAN